MKFQYFQSTKDNQRYWRRRAANGRIVAVGGEGSTTKPACLDSRALANNGAGSAPVEEVDG